MASDTDVIETIYYLPGCEWLDDWADNINSQSGEDGLVMGIFDRLGRPKHRNEWAMEAGASDGVTFSNTRQLLNQGWDVVYVECDDEKFAELKENTANYPTAYCFHEVLESLGKNSIDGILNRTDAPKELDLLSLDIDGGEAWIWDGITEHEFVVVICEVLHTSSSLKLVHSIALARGYTVVARTQYNVICVRNECMDALLNGSPGGAP